MVFFIQSEFTDFNIGPSELDSLGGDLEVLFRVFIDIFTEFSGSGLELKFVLHENFFKFCLCFWRPSELFRGPVAANFSLELRFTLRLGS